MVLWYLGVDGACGGCSRHRVRILVLRRLGAILSRYPASRRRGRSAWHYTIARRRIDKQNRQGTGGILIRGHRSTSSRRRFASFVSGIVRLIEQRTVDAGITAAVHLELGENVVHVVFTVPIRSPGAGDLLIGATGGNKVEHLRFAIRQFLDVQGIERQFGKFFR